MSELPKYFIAYIIGDRIKPNTNVTENPLHLTVAPPFTIAPDIKLSAIEDIMRYTGQSRDPIQLAYGETHEPISLELGEFAWYGERANEFVREILDPSDELHRLHDSLTARLGAAGCNFIGLKWTYSPHVACKNGHGPTEPFVMDSLTLLREESDVKTVLSTIALGKNTTAIDF